MHQGLDFSQVALGQGGDKVKPTPFILQLSSARKDVASPSTEGKMADTAPLPLSGEKWSQNIPDRSAGTAAQFRARDTLEDRLQLIQPATVHRRANWKLMTWPTHSAVRTRNRGAFYCDQTRCSPGASGPKALMSNLDFTGSQ